MPSFTTARLSLGKLQEVLPLLVWLTRLRSTMGLDHNMQLIMSGVLNVTQLIGVLTSLWTLDSFGRRKILMYGSVGMFISHFIIAILVGLYSHNWPANTDKGWTSVAFLLFYMLAFGASWGPVPWAMPSEIFPSSLRAKGVSISTCSSKWRLSETMWVPLHADINRLQTGSTTSLW